MEILQIIADLQRYAAAEQALRAKFDARAAAVERMRQWFHDGLDGMQPALGQRHDTHLEPFIGLTTIAKRLIAPMRFYARTHRLERRTGHLLGEALINCNAVSPAALRGAFAKAGKLQVRQMRDPDQRSAGFILDGTDVSDDGVATVRFVVSDAAAMQKLASRTYSGVVLSVDDAGEITDLSLVDTATDFVGEFAKRSPEVIAKVFSNESKVMSKLINKAKKMSKRTGLPVADCADALAKVRKGPTIPIGLAKAITEAEQAAALTGQPGVDQMAAKARQGRAADNLGVQLIKAIRSNPGNRLGGPRFDHR